MGENELTETLRNEGPDYTFIVKDHSVYYTIQATSTTYVTFDPYNFHGVLPANETIVGPYEKFDFTPVH